MHQDWPRFAWEAKRLVPYLSAARYKQGRLLGKMQDLGYQLKKEATLAALTEETVKSSAIEGEELNPESVRSSLARRMGLEAAGTRPVDRNVEGIVEMMLDATQNFAAPLTIERLFGWHAALFPTGYTGMTKITVGAWRDDRSGPMQVVSGPIGRERVHYEPPPRSRLDAQMDRFLTWFNGPQKLNNTLRACLAHLWFETLHPFEGWQWP